MRKNKNILALPDTVIREDRTQSQMKAIVPMLVMVVTVFILCWTPILIFEVTFHFPANDLKNILQVLQAFDVIGLQVFGLVKHIKTFCSLLAYVNRLIL